MNPEISVILPFYNAEKTLLSAIKSILMQTHTHFELLLINNNSTDESLQIAQKIAATDGRIRLLTEKKQGVAHAMNNGLGNARGQFLARMDADDISCPERLEKQVRFLKDNPGTRFVGSTVEYVSHHPNTDGFKRFVSWVNAFLEPDEIELYRFIEIPVVNPTILFHREIYQHSGGCVQGDLPEDYEMQLRLLEDGVKMAKLPEPLLEWHDSPTRLTRTDSRYSTEAFFRVKALYFQKWSKKNNPFHPCIWVWGAGRKTRRKADILEKEGLKVQGYIDIVKGKTSKKTLIHCENIPPPGELFIVPMVAKYGARELIREKLSAKLYEEGKDYIFMA